MLLNKKILAQYSILPINYNYSEVMQYVDVTEKIWIIKLIGYDMYEELCEQVEENRLTPENSTLLVEAIYPLLGFAVVYEALPSIAYHASEVSLTKGQSENSSPLTLKELSYFQDHIRRQVEVRKDYAIQWICEHQEYYPLIVTNCNCDCYSCCSSNKGKLTSPNKYQQLYSPRKKCTTLL